MTQSHNVYQNSNEPECYYITYMTIAEWVTNSSETFGRDSNDHEDGCTEQDAFDRMPKVGI